MLLLSSATILAGLRVLSVILFAILVLFVFPSVGVMVFDDWKASAKPARRARHRRVRGNQDPWLQALVETFRAGKLSTALPVSVNPGSHVIVRHRRVAT